MRLSLKPALAGFSRIRHKVKRSAAQGAVARVEGKVPLNEEASCNRA